MGSTEQTIDIPAELEKNVCGHMDVNLHKIERTLQVTMIERDGSVKVMGEESKVQKAISVFTNLVALARRGETISEQTVNYALSLSFAEGEEKILEIDREMICRTASGRPVKPKTLGQKAYVDSIARRMITFGIGPAGTGKTYLAMAMAIRAFRDGDCERIILTRPAMEAGEKLGFLPGDLQSKIDPYLRPLYDALYQIMGAESYLHNAEKGLIEVAPRAKHDARADEDVSDPHRLRFEGDYHGRPHPEGFAGRCRLGSRHGVPCALEHRGHRLLPPHKPRCRAASARTADCRCL